MVNPRIVKRYALALMKSASATTLEPIYNDLLAVERIIGASKDLKVLLRSPVVEYRKKQAIFKEIFDSVIGKDVLGFIMLLLEKKREIMFKDIILAFKNLYNERHNIQSVSIVSAVSLDQSVQSKIIATIEAKINKKIEPNFVVNTKLKGGVIITIGDMTYDGSVRRQIELLYKQMTGKDMPEQLRESALA